jgi:hypothetical protein
MEINLAEKYIPTEKQSAGHKCLARYPFYGGAVGGGKSVWGVMDGLQLSYEFPGNVGLICRWELPALRRTTLDTFFKFCPQSLIAHHNKVEGLIHLVGGSKILYMGLKPSSDYNALTRLGSLDLGWFFIDEAPEVPKKYFDMLKTRLRLRLPDGSFPRYRGMLAGNPTPGWVRDIFIDQDLPDHAFIPALPNDNPHLPPGYIDQLIQDLPPELIERLVKGNWDVWEGDNYIFPYSWVKAAIDRELVPEDPIEAGVDVGGGSAETVGAIRRGPVVRLPLISRHKNTMTSTGEIAQFIEDGAPRITKIDSVGIGQPVYDRLRELKYKVVPIIGGGSAKKAERFVNAKSENHWGLRMKLEAGTVDLPNDRKLRSQLVSIQYDTQSDRRIAVETKKARAARSLESPDRADAVINAFAEGYIKRKGKARVI